MYTVRRITLVTLATVTLVARRVLRGTRDTVNTSGGRRHPELAIDRHLHPIGQRRRCLLCSAPSTTTCVAVGDDGGHVASVIVTENDGATWSDATPPSGVTTLSAVSCPSAAVCYAGGGSGIYKSSNGGETWTVQDSSFPAQSISCFTSMNARRWADHEIVETTEWIRLGSHKRRPQALDSLASVSLSQRHYLRCRWMSMTDSCDRWDSGRHHLDHARSTICLVISSGISVCNGDDCVAVGIADGGGATSLSTIDLTAWIRRSRLSRSEHSYALACPHRDHMHRRRHQPQLNPVRRQHVEQRIHLVTPDPAQQCRRSHRSLLLDCR